MRTSQYLLSTLKETPAHAEVVSHQLMLRAGLIRHLASGLYTWLPTGWAGICPSQSPLPKWVIDVAVYPFVVSVV